MSTPWRHVEARFIQAKTQFLALTPLRRAFLLLLLAVVACYLGTSFWIGGDAFQGREDEGRFFVAHHKGAAEHEVSRATFLLSLWELRALFAVWAVGICAAVLDRVLIAWRTRGLG